ncbi:17-beta-hydroxysteroid dehydrogenase type 6 [Halotydeus destructor]|nr:17-beta-hydroxysteroid dehydrogenase type 6 [Halotydeus destructor]
MMGSLLKFWAIFAIVFGLFIFITSVNFIQSVVQSVTNFLLLGLLGYVSWNLTNYIWAKATFITKDKVSPVKKAVLITGCDTGFGHELAVKLDLYGFKVFAGCLFPDRDGAQSLKKKASNRLTVIKLDVTSDEDVFAARATVDKAIGGHELWAVVNNAGILASTEIEMGSMTTFNSQMEVNCLGVIRVTKAFLPLVRKCSGRVVNVASLAGRFAIPGMVGYCVSKAAVISFSEGLRREMKKWDIDVITIEPHLFNTNLCNNEANQRVIENAWLETREEIKAEYGDCYFEGYKRFLNKVLGSARPRIGQVVDTMMVAVTEQFVGPTYQVLGDLEALRIWMWTLWPTRALDYLSYWAAIMQTGMPLAKARAIYEKKSKTN